MTEQHDSKPLVEAILIGELTFDAALEQYLDDADADLELTHAALVYFNLGQLGRVLDFPGDPTVATVVEKFDLKLFAPLLNNQEPDRDNEIQYPVGTVVNFYGDVCRVIGRRRVTIFAMPREDEFEVFLESLDGEPMYFVGESMVTPLDDGE